jgi:hypothetical protein
MRSQLFQAGIAASVLLPATVVAQTSQPLSLRLSPPQAVMNAAEMPAGVSGVFEMVVRSSGRQSGLLYLNSELDYRDPRNLTIVVAPREEMALASRLGGPVEAALARKVIAVRGTAKKTRIDFIADGRRTEKYYYQTHLILNSARDLTVEGERPTH